MENQTGTFDYDNLSLLLLTNDSAKCNATSSILDGYSIFLLILKALPMISIILVAFFGNVLVILSIFLNRRLQVTTNYFLVSLAIADMLVASCAMTFNALLEVTGEWLFGPFMCDLYNSFDVYFSTVSILNLCCISMDRYYAIIKPLEYPIYMTNRIVKVMLTLSWFTPTLISFLPIFMGWYATGEHLEYLNDNPEICSFEVNTVYAFVSSSVSFWIPCAIMLVLYYKVLQAARKQETAMMSHANSMTTLHNVQTPKRSVNFCFKKFLPKRRKKSNSGDIHVNNELPMFSISLVSPKTSRPRTQSIYSSISADTSLACCSIQDNLSCHCSQEVTITPSGMFCHRGDREGTPGSSNHVSASVSETLSPIVDQINTKHTKCHRHSRDSAFCPNLYTVNSGKRLSYSAHSTNNAPTMRREHKAAKTLGIVMGAFIVCWLPFFVWYLTVHICTSSCESPPWVVVCLFWFGYFNSTLNPFIYAYNGKDFREAFKRTLKRMNFCRKSTPDL